MNEVTSYGKVAYERYAQHREWKAFNGNPIPKWEEVQPDIKAAWEEAAKAVHEVDRSILEFAIGVTIGAMDANGETDMVKRLVALLGRICHSQDTI